MYSKLETTLFAIVYTLAAVVIVLDMFYWRPY